MRRDTIPPHFDYKVRNSTMKNFKIKIRYCGYSTDFNVQCKDTPQDIENSILDKLGKDEVKFEKNGFTSKTGKWITYEEVNHDRGPIQTEKVLGIKLGARAS
jgi:hypothetical protein